MCSKTSAFSLSLLYGTAHATLECQTEVRENVVSKYHFPKKKMWSKVKKLWIKL